MENIIVTGIFLVSIIFSIIAYQGHLFYKPEEDKKVERKDAPWSWKFFEGWRFFVSFFLGGLIIYYFISVRWDLIFIGGTLYVSDFVLLFILVLCATGLFPYALKNITDAMNLIISKILK